ncbi:MAG: hypothetical protein ACE14L_16785 [Terriglobales bacterium]
MDSGVERNRSFRDVEFSRLEPCGYRTDPDVVDGWGRTLECGKPIPPPVAVLMERGTYYVYDGNHRYEALKQYMVGKESGTVRIGLVVPLPGYQFTYRWMGEFETYVLEAVPRRFACAAIFLTPLLSSVFAMGPDRGVAGCRSESLLCLLCLVRVDERVARRMEGRPAGGNV